MRKKKQYGITLGVAQKHLEEWLEAELNVTAHQSYQLGARTLTLANLSEIRKEIEYWDGMVKKLESAAQSGGRNRIYPVVPRDW